MNAKAPFDRVFDALIGRELQRINAHLPKQRRALSELLKLSNPTVEAVDGSSILLKSSELNALAEIVPAEYRDRVKLPFIIVRRMDLGKSVYTVSGDLIEDFTVQKIIGNTDDFHELYKHNEPAFLYRPQLTELLNQFHSLVVIGFGIPNELRNYGPSRD
jgi:uncharacterized protein (UPF0216 family)